MLGKIKVRFKLAWQNYRVGDVIQPPGTLRQWLLTNGYVELVPEVSEAPAPTPTLDTRKPLKRSTNR